MALWHYLIIRTRDNPLPEELKAFDDEMDALITEADAAGEVLRFVGAIDVATGVASVKLGRYSKDWPSPPPRYYRPATIQVGSSQWDIRMQSALRRAMPMEVIWW